MVTQKTRSTTPTLVAFTRGCQRRQSGPQGGDSQGKNVNETIRKEAFRLMQKANCIWLAYELAPASSTGGSSGGARSCAQNDLQTRSGASATCFTSKHDALATWLRSDTRSPWEAGALEGAGQLSRFSGQEGRNHIEHDTSFEGTRQLIDRAPNAWGLTVFIV